METDAAGCCEECRPWHPANFRNQVKVWEAEQRELEVEKRRKITREEYQREQEYEHTLSMLSDEERRKYKERQSVSFLYQKPPGFQDSAAGETQTSEAPESVEERRKSDLNLKTTRQGTNDEKKNGDRKHVENVIKGIQAVSKENLILKKAHGMSPPRGGIPASAENQQLVLPELESEEEEAMFKMAMMTDEERREYIKQERRNVKRMEKARIREARRVLEAAGIERKEIERSIASKRKKRQKQ